MNYYVAKNNIATNLRINLTFLPVAFFKIKPLTGHVAFTAHLFYKNFTGIRSIG